MNPALPLYTIASLRAKARLAMAGREQRTAIALLRQAVTEEDGLAYNEPADEFFPTRHLLGAALLAARMARDAEAVYREDLRRNPINGWALVGLANSLQAQGKVRAALGARRKFEIAWKNSDIIITASAF